MSKLRLVKGSPFVTLQGEGANVGVPSIFLRTAGCDLRCARIGGRGWFCDTPESLPDYDHRPGKLHFLPEPTKHAFEVEHQAMAAQIATLGVSQLVITGGEPMLQADALSELLAVIHENGSDLHITVETNARHFDPVFASWVDLASLSPKLATMGEQENQVIDQWLMHAAYFDKAIQLKIVCVDGEDYVHARAMFKHARSLHHKVECVVQPAYGIDTKTDHLIQLVIGDDKLCRFIPQCHKVLGLP